MLRIPALVTIASAPGWLVAISTDQLILGWALSVTLVVVAVALFGNRPAIAPTMQSASAGWVILEREVARARRYGQALTLIHIQDGSTPVRVADVAATGREIDIAWEDDGVWLLAVGADQAGREPLLARLRGAIPGLEADRLRAMTFPADAMTVRALIAGLTTGTERPVRLPVRPADARDELAFGQETVPTAEGGSA